MATLPTTTMVGCFEGNPPGETVLARVLRGEWFLPDPSTPACGLVRYVRPDETNDGVERMFVCDLPAGHAEERHRQVTDAAEGKTLTWAVGEV